MLPRKVASVLMRRSLRGCWAVTGSKVNPQAAHLFMICSNIKLRWPEESIAIGVHNFRKQSQWDRRNLRPPAGIEPSLAAMTFLNRTENAHGHDVTHVCP